MSLNPAARFADVDACPVHGVSNAVGGSSNVTTNSKPALRVGDQSPCPAGPVDVVLIGSGNVEINGQPAARMTSLMLHAGRLVNGSPNVWIGGPDAAAILDPSKAIAACAALAATRHTPGRKRQSYGNCGIESWRAYINQQRAAQGLPPLTEDQLMELAQQQGAGKYDPAHPWRYGASGPDTRRGMLDQQGIPAGTDTATPQNIQQALAEGRPVSTDVWANDLWDPGMASSPDSFHHVQVVGVVRDGDGDVIGYVINDSGTGECGKFIPKDRFDKALSSSGHPPGHITVGPRP